MRIGLAWMGLSLMLAACGGATTSDLQGDAAPNGTKTDAGDQDATTRKDAGPPVQDASPVDDGPTTVDVDQPDVPVGPPDSKIHCGGTTCSAQSEFCCRSGNVSNAYTYTCMANADSAKCTSFGDVAITCSSKENCVSQGSAGDVCCAQVVQGQQCTLATQTACQSSCNGQAGEFEVGCDPQQVNSCGVNATCKVSQCSLIGYPICIGN